MRETTAAVLEQIKALSEEERQELLAAPPSVAPQIKITTAGREKIHEALAWRYQGRVDDAARVEELRR